MSLEDVPHFVEADNYPINFHDWLVKRELMYIELTCDNPSEYWGHHIIVGRSPRGEFLHCVIGLNGYPIFDPHPSDAMILSEDVEKWLYGFIVPRR
ncbi:MAG: hypothetical protein KGI50_05810 [Patescibacteria group bacterium]|nr:hypothetical protein [Patescibacteria group bacterium]MDE2438792.1 hypothetical protein [Patescibacteria group bacterium]